MGKEVAIAEITNKLVEPISQNKKSVKGNMLISEYIFQHITLPYLSTRKCHNEQDAIQQIKKRLIDKPK
jgi:hypothetical protein